MVLLSKIAAGGLVLMIGIPSVAAKIYPDDFLIPGQVAVSTPVAAEAPVVDATSSSSDSSPLFFPSDIPDGPLTNGQLIDAIGSRLYDTDAQGACFADLVSLPAANYNLLFSDLSITQPLALSVCTMMQNGLVRGSSNMLHPNQPATAAEAATIFSRLSAPIRNPVGNEPWYRRYMETMRSIDPAFSFRPTDVITGQELRAMICVLKNATPQLDPAGEFVGC